MSEDRPVTASKAVDRLPDEILNELAQAELARIKMETYKASEIARESKINGDTSQIHFDRENVKWKEEQADDKYNNIYFFGSSVSEQSTTACMKRLTVWDYINPNSDIEIVFSSPGG